MITSLQKAQIKSKAKRATQRLRELEKQGLEKSSSAYRWAKMTHYDGKFMTETKKGQIKFTGKISKMSQTDLQDYSEMLDKFLSAKTSKASETKKSLDKAYQSFVDNPENADMSNVSRDEWEEAWTDDLFKRVNEKFGYEETFRIMNELNNIKNVHLSTTDLKEMLQDIDIENSTLEQFTGIINELIEFRQDLSKGGLLLP